VEGVLLGQTVVILYSAPLHLLVVVRAGQEVPATLPLPAVLVVVGLEETPHQIPMEPRGIHRLYRLLRAILGVIVMPRDFMLRVAVAGAPLEVVETVLVRDWLAMEETARHLQFPVRL
jgi:hypothetical protein